jgi:hypothetical protein
MGNDKTQQFTVLAPNDMRVVLPAISPLKFASLVSREFPRKLHPFSEGQQALGKIITRATN